MPAMFHSDILKWMKDKKKMVKFIKKVLNVSRENSSKGKNQNILEPEGEDEDPDNIGKLIDILRRFSMPSSQQSWYGKLFAICIIEERDDVSFVPDSNLFKLNQMGRRFR